MSLPSCQVAFDWLDTQPEGATRKQIAEAIFRGEGATIDRLHTLREAGMIRWVGVATSSGEAMGRWATMRHVETAHAAWEARRDASAAQAHQNALARQREYGRKKRRLARVPEFVPDMPIVQRWYGVGEAPGINEVPPASVWAWAMAV